MIRGAIFDLDGTLLDSMPVWDTLASDYLRSLGTSPKPGLDEAVSRMSVEQAAEYIRGEYGLAETPEEIVRGVNGMLGDFYRQTAPLKPGVPGFLERLREGGAKMCVATATDRSLVEAALLRTGVREYFSEIFTCAGVGHGKDEPDIFRAALAHLGTPKSATVVFEDALHAVATAKRDGFVVAAVYDSHEPRCGEAAALADVRICDFADAAGFWSFASGV